MHALRDRDERVPLAGIVHLDYAYWTGSAVASAAVARPLRGRSSPRSNSLRTVGPASCA